MDKQIFPEDSQSKSPATMATMIGNKAGTAIGIVDHFSLVRELGRGAFAAVYLARDTFSGDEVALKPVDPSLKDDIDAMQAFKDKFVMLRKLRHKHIAELMEIKQAESVSYFSEPASGDASVRFRQGDPYVVMRYAPGKTLRQMLKEAPGGVLDVGDATEICRQVAEALDEAHTKGIVHRDIKPANIAVAKDENGEWDVQILDFGLAGEIPRSRNEGGGKKGDTSGTPEYQAPEQWCGKEQDGRTDQYSLAVVLQQLVSGSIPFSKEFEEARESRNYETARAKVMTSARLSVGLLEPAARDALVKALSIRKEDRFPTCAAFIDAFRGRDLAADPFGSPERDDDVPQSRPSAPESSHFPDTAGLPPEVRKMVEVWMRLRRNTEKLAACVRSAGFSLSTRVPTIRKLLESRGWGNRPEGRRPSVSSSGAPRRRMTDNSIDAPSFASIPMPRITPLSLGNGLSFEMARLPAGEFRMGSPHDEAGRQPGESLHVVRLSPFYLAVAPVTQAKWRAVEESLPPQPDNHPDWPVVNVSWEDACGFLDVLNRRFAKGGYRWSLPTEAQWEYACRAGSYSRFAGTGRVDEMAWHSGNSEDHLHPIRQKNPNAWGLYDMEGLVWEWCADGWSPSLGNAKRTDPRYPVDDTKCVVRGGSWNHNAACCRSASRRGMVRTARFDSVGFRVALVPES